MNVAKGLQLHDLFLFFPLACENKHRIEKVFALIMEGKLVLCDFFLIRVVSELSRRHVNHKPQRFGFLNEMMGIVNFIFHIIKIYFF